MSSFQGSPLLNGRGTSQPSVIRNGRIRCAGLTKNRRMRRYIRLSLTFNLSSLAESGPKPPGSEPSIMMFHLHFEGIHDHRDVDRKPSGAMTRKDWALLGVGGVWNNEERDAAGRNTAMAALSWSGLRQIRSKPGFQISQNMVSASYHVLMSAKGSGVNHTGNVTERLVFFFITFLMESVTVALCEGLVK